MARNRIDITVTGLDTFSARLDAYLDRVEENIRSAVDTTMRELRDTSIQNLNASLVSGSKSIGNLQQAHGITPDDDGLGGRVFVDSDKAPYAVAQNYGIPSPEFLGFVHVRAHTRQINAAFGRLLDSPVTVNVRAHDRQMNIPAKLFWTNAVEEVRPKHLQRMEEAVRNA